MPDLVFPFTAGRVSRGKDPAAFPWQAVVHHPEWTPAAMLMVSRWLSHIARNPPADSLDAEMLAVSNLLEVWSVSLREHHDRLRHQNKMTVRACQWISEAVARVKARVTIP